MTTNFWYVNDKYVNILTLQCLDTVRVSITGHCKSAQGEHCKSVYIFIWRHCKSVQVWTL